MRIVITGSSGLVGVYLQERLKDRGVSVTRMIRGSSVTDEDEPAVSWNPALGEIDAAGLEGYDAVIHLAGENISSGRWTSKQKEKIRTSRTQGTTLLAETLAGLKRPPRVLVCASAIGYYGHQDPERQVTEGTPRGNGFLAAVTAEWERSTEVAQQAGIRVVHLRFGMILSDRGGALAKMLPVFQLGVGGRIGGGRQMISWVSLEEIPPVILFLLDRAEMSGPINVVSPHPVTNREFTRVLGRVLNRRAILPLPGFAARIALGEMAEELLLSGCRVVPQKLEEAGYRFRHPDLEPALHSLLK